MLHGIPELTKDRHNYVRWRGREVEHFTFQDEEDEKQAAQRLAKKCRYLEDIGVPVTTGNAVWWWSVFEEMDADHPLKEFFMLHPGLWEHVNTRQGCPATGRILWIVERGSVLDDDDNVLTAWDPVDQQLTQLLDVEYKPYQAGYYHTLRAKGWQLPDCGQGGDAGPGLAPLSGIEDWLHQHDAFDVVARWTKEYITRNGQKGIIHAPAS